MNALNRRGVRGAFALLLLASVLTVFRDDARGQAKPAQVTNPGSAQVTNPGSAQVTNQGSAQVTNPGSAQVTNPGNAQVTNPGNAQVTNQPNPQVTNQPKARGAGNGEPPKSESGDCTIRRLPCATRCDASIPVPRPKSLPSPPSTSTLSRPATSTLSPPPSPPWPGLLSTPSYRKCVIDQCGRVEESCIEVLWQDRSKKSEEERAKK